MTLKCKIFLLSTAKWTELYEKWKEHKYYKWFVSSGDNVWVKVFPSLCPPSNCGQKCAHSLKYSITWNMHINLQVNNTCTKLFFVLSTHHIQTTPFYSGECINVTNVSNCEQWNTFCLWAKWREKKNYNLKWMGHTEEEKKNDTKREMFVCISTMKLNGWAIIKRDT